MNGNTKVTAMKSSQIIDLYLNMPNNTMQNISEIVRYSAPTVSRIITAYLSGEIFHERKHFLILTSKINEL